MSEDYASRIAELMKQFQQELAEIEARNEQAVRDVIEKIRQRRLAELRNDITSPQ